MTILFKEDWEHLHPTAIVDMKTKNKEFIRLAALYRSMGVKNNEFILSLVDPDLQGVDPYDPQITPELVEKIQIECKNNFWYFIREIARDPAGSDDAPIMFRPNRGVISAYWLYFNHIVFILIMIRQTGKSFGIDWLYTYLLNIALTKSEISQLTKDERLRGRELERLKSMELTLPFWMKRRSPRDPGNTEVLKISALENTFKSYVPNKSPKIADQIGRGMTSANIGVDELAYIFNNFITVQVMLSASLAAREVARIKNEPYGTIFTTTSGKRDTPEGKYAYRLVSEAAVFSEAFYDCRNPEQLEKTICSASSDGKTLRVNCTFNHQQLGYTDDWLRARLREAMQEDQTQIEADYLNRWPSGTISSPFSKEIANMIRDSEVLDYYTMIDGQDCYALRWYYPEAEIEPRMFDEPHVLSIDSSDAVGRDAIGIVLTPVSTGEVAMAATISMTNLISFAMWICQFLMKFQKVTCIIERRGSGATIIDYLLLYLPTMGMDPFKRLYNTAVQEYLEYPDRFKEIMAVHNSQEDLYTKYKKCFGWATSGTGATSRTDLYSKTLSQATRTTGSLMRDRTLILQILGLVIKNGRVDHEDGEHDDMVISYLLSFWLISMGKNLSYYGINPAEILRRNPNVLKQQQEKGAFERYMNQRTKNEIENIVRSLENETDEYVSRRLEYDLERAMAKLTEEDREVLAMDDLIQKLRDKRKNQVQRTIPQYHTYSPNTGYQGGYSNTVYYN